jgi:Tfp pilus assembly protein PilF
MPRIGVWVAMTTALIVRPLTAQLPAADSAFKRGDYRAARAAYERVLAADSNNVAALYRLAILDSWDGQLRRSLRRFTRLRRLAPDDGDIMVSQAQVLAWAGETHASEALYDTVLGRWPERVDALTGRAQALAWGGDLDRAEQLWRDALATHPDEPELLIGLAQTLYWKGEPGLAEAYAARARTLAPGDRTALDLERSLRAALRPEVSSSSDEGQDSDNDDFLLLNGSYTSSLGSATRGTLHAMWRRNTDPVRADESYGFDARAVVPLGSGAQFRAGVGVRRLASDSGPGTTPATAELGIGIRPARYATLNLGYSHSPFDDTALLIERGFVIDALEAGFDLSPSAHWDVSGGGGTAWVSDGNQRYSAVLAVLARVSSGLEFGPFARVLGYRTNLGDGYFAPDRLSVFEGRSTYNWRHDRWGIRADGGVGSQQVFVGAPFQTEWHFGLVLTRSWGWNSELALVGSLTNSAAATSAGGVRSEAYRYSMLALRFQEGL